MGIYDPALCEAAVRRFTCWAVTWLVVHGSGLDEVALHGPTTVLLQGVRDLAITITPEEAGLYPAPVEALAGAGPDENAGWLLELLKERDGGPGRRGRAQRRRPGLDHRACADAPAGTRLARQALDGGGAAVRLAGWRSALMALDEILAHKRSEIAARKAASAWESLRARAKPTDRSLAQALRAGRPDSSSRSNSPPLGRRHSRRDRSHAGAGELSPHADVVVGAHRPAVLRRLSRPPRPGPRTPGAAASPRISSWSRTRWWKPGYRRRRDPADPGRDRRSDLAGLRGPGRPARDGRAHRSA